MKIKHLEVTNFRCFKSLDLDLHPQLNVVVGANGSGKTAFLYACRNAIGSFINCLPIVWTEQAALNELDINYSFDISTNKFIRENEIRIDFTTIEPLLNGNRILKKRILEKKGKGSFKVAGSIRNWAKEVVSEIQLGVDVNLPVLLFLGTERFKIERKEYDRPTLGERYEGYFNAMNGKSATFRFEKWFFNRFVGDLQNQQQQLGRNFSDLELMQKAVGTFYPYAERIYYNFDVEQLVLVLKSGEHKPLHDLSDGERFMFLTCITIAYYCIQLNRHLGEGCLQKSSGVVMIDEIDLHLHPKWQREILPKLVSVFPNIQFIVTTHSPQVLSSVKRENLLILREYGIDSAAKFIEGRDSNSILNEVFEDADRAPEKQVKLDEYYALLAKKQFDAAENLLKILTSIWGQNDTTILRALFHLNDSKEEA